MTTFGVDEVAADLGLARSTVILYLRAGEIRGGFQVVPGGKWCIDEGLYRQWKADRVAEFDPHRIEPRSARSRAAQSRRR
ncbi:hypothetical protein [Cellulomonas iranensis]|uniref:hypothetical protein n=1 Tax=Cellulomonas iranensis TaxID=76862 RepID=UPI003D7DF7CA